MDENFNRWMNFYNNIKDPSWPNCANEHEFWSLPKQIQQEILELHNGSIYVALNDQDIEDLSDSQTDPIGNNSETKNLLADNKFQVGKDFYVYYHPDMVFGGVGPAQDYPRIVKYLYPARKFTHCLDWCAGAGFLGFRFLADDICENVTLMDCFFPAMEACKTSMEHMPKRFHDRVNLVHSDVIDGILDTSAEKFDLVVGIPPLRQLKKYDNIRHSTNSIRLLSNPGLKIHQEFFKNIGKYLSDDGIILLQKHIELSDALDFEQFINDGGLKITKLFREKSHPDNYYMEIKHR
jgi:16S rRNA G966 N2-methylase RsmD